MFCLRRSSRVEPLAGVYPKNIVAGSFQTTTEDVFYFVKLFALSVMSYDCFNWIWLYILFSFELCNAPVVF